MSGFFKSPVRWALNTSFLQHGYKFKIRFLVVVRYNLWSGSLKSFEESLKNLKQFSAHIYIPI